MVKVVPDKVPEKTFKRNSKTMAKLSSFLGVLSTVQVAFYTKLRGKYVGMDDLGNKYYTMPGHKGVGKRERRFVMYKDAPEASLVPPQWHGWLHHQTDVMPGAATEKYNRDWQQDHEPNKTGTSEAYRPPGHTMHGGKRDKATGDYEAWTPPE